MSTPKLIMEKQLKSSANENMGNLKLICATIIWMERQDFFIAYFFFFSCYGELVRTLYLLYNVQIYGLDPLVR